MTPSQTTSGFAWRNSPALSARREQAKVPTAKQQCKPFSKPIAGPLGGVDSHSIAAKNSPYSTGLKPEAMDKLPPLDPKWIISRPEPRMSEAAKHFHMLKFRLELCMEDRRYDDLVYSTECRLREQAAYIIGYRA